MSASTSEGIALITGSSQGIGKAIAIRLASDGFEIAINDIPAKSLTLEATQKEIQELTGKRALICVGDVSVEEEVKGMIEEVVKSLGGIDVMVANAGICPCGPLNDVTLDEWERAFAVNVRGTFLCYKYASLQMIAQGRGGRLIGASSGGGKQGQRLMGLYSSTKFAIRGLTQSAALEYGKHGITVNAYCPGPIDTEMVRKAAQDVGGDTEKVLKMYAQMSAVGRIGNPADVANLVSFLASKHSEYLTGQTIIIDGGLIFD
ncbi:MAG: short chain oxidoreductase [Lentinula lateritia]|uniref:Short chain oxidoreductase n=2 Tax=Lentinula TaxID=5352 RepID=A0ACC1TW58_9AGAR|nr:acetoin reductase family protein [Lentinula edodes]KAJ3809019.1 short chain oxidoreductase [Lentinula aff. lateritia]KAJ3859505.1 short chain oxidoreductase [Lentinula novae-zelandiae]KAJ3929541.1 MAG: short chain oxidoreductase [Lentinula lateritia]KAH7872719.1 acetoin reductase family protein [Lentinula edodes]KAJ3876600.1 short chain oxidoreductase [Lentinula edodes]